MNTSSNRLRIALLFGGRSPEHDVSLSSAANVMRALDPAKYEAVPVFITREGRWLLSAFADGKLATPSSGTEVCLVPGGQGRMVALPDSGASYELPKIDILFPVLHGPNGEDGSVQGLAEVALVPLAGCGLLGSATAMDKDITKRLLIQAGLPVARFITIHQRAVPTFAELQSRLGLPFFLKPARQGSSIGINIVSSEQGYETALATGFKYDDKLVAEEFIQGRELECAVLEDTQGGLFVSRFGEITPAENHGFYSYDAKYIDAAGAALKVPVDLPGDVENAMRKMAAQAFRLLGCDGMARVDFFVTPDQRILINELNTIPGFTNISMYPKTMEASGVSYPGIIDRLVAHGLARAALFLKDGTRSSASARANG